MEKIGICFEKDRIEVTGGEWKFKFSLPNLKVSPLSCRGLKCLPTGELQCTLQTECTSYEVQQSHKSTFDILQSEMVAKILKYQESCSCSICFNKLLAKQSKFQRVLPLPSESWSEMVMNTFCHGTLSNGSSSLLPRPGDCLVSDLYFLVSSSQLNISVLTIHPETRLVQCKRCRQELGVVLNTDCQSQARDGEFACKFFSHTMSFLPSQNGISDEDFKRLSLSEEFYLVCLLQEESQAYTSFRFIAESTSPQDSAQTVTCLLWLMDINTEVYEANLSYSGHKHRELVLQPELKMKVLYKCRIWHSDEKNSDGALFSLWKSDQSVHKLDLSYHLCMKLVEILVDSTWTTPASCQNLNGFHVGFLRTTNGS